MPKIIETCSPNHHDLRLIQ